MSVSPFQMHLMHAFGIGPLFVYIGLYRENVPDIVFNGIGILAFVILAYHMYRAYTKLRENQSAWVNWIHILLIAPLLLIIAYLKKDASRRYFEMMLLLGFAAIGYHGVYLAQDILLC